MATNNDINNLSGTILQQVIVSNNTTGLTSSITPFSSTPTTGTTALVVSQSLTPKSTTSTLVFDVSVQLNPAILIGNSNCCGFFLFQGSSVIASYPIVSRSVSTASFKFYVDSPGIVSTTYSLRYASINAVITYLNQTANNQTSFGGLFYTTFMITEFAS